MKKSIFVGCGLVALASLAAGAETYVWTGAADNKWTNAANWTVGGAVATKAPGVAYAAGHGHSTATASLTEEWTAWSNECDTAVFDATGAAQTTIDLAAFFSISNIVIRGADAPSYTFGTSTSQILPLRNFGAIRIAEEVANDQIFLAVTTAGIGTSSNGKVAGTGYITFRNDSTAGAVYRHYEVAVTRKAYPTSAGWVETYITYAGAGAFEINQGAEKKGVYRNWPGEPPSLLVYLELRNTSAFTVKSCSNVGSIKGVQILTAGDPIEIAEGAIFGIGDNGSGYFIVYADREIKGAGTLVQKTLNRHLPIQTTSDKRLTVSCPVNANLADNTKYQSYWLHAGGIIRLANPNNVLAPAGYFLALTGTLTLEIASDAAADADVRFDYAENGTAKSGASTLAYLGSGDTRERGFRLTSSYGGILSQQGTGAWTIAGVVTQTVAQSQLVLTGDAAAEGVFAAPFVSTMEGGSAATLDLVKRGAGTWRLTADSAANGGSTTLEAGTLVLDSGAQLPTGAVTLKGGTLDVRTTVTLPAVTATAGATTLAVADGATVTLASFTAAGGTLDILPSGSGIVRVASGTTATGLSYKGMPASIRDGQIVPGTPDRIVAARGDVIPDAADASVLILNVGTDGHDTLAADTTTVGLLAQYANVPSTVAIGAGQTLAASSVAVGTLTQSLTLGDTAGQGVLAAPADEKIVLANGTSNATLTVNAALDASATVTTSAGPVVFAGGTAGTNDLTVGNARTVLKDGAFVFDDFWLGTNVADGVSEMLVTNATVFTADPTNMLYVGRMQDSVPVYTNPDPLPPVAKLTVADSTWVSALVTNTALLKTGGSSIDLKGAFSVGYGGRGVLEIRDGAVITNRLAVGGESYRNNGFTAFSRGAVYQYGGSMTALSPDYFHYDYGARIGGYGYAQGYYELRGGDFTARGPITVGTYGSGIFVQYGGASSLRRALDGTTATTLLNVSGANSGCGSVRVHGGTMNIDGSVSLAGGTQATSAELTVTDTGKISVGYDLISANAGAKAHSAVTSVNVLNGGTLEYAYMGKDKGKMFVYADGGVLQLCGYNRNIFAKNGGDVNFVSRVFVGPRGLTIDTQTRFYGNRTKVPLEAPVSTNNSYGVVGVKGFTPVAGRMMEPRCEVTGDGEGASAYALFDSRSGTVTNIVISSPGVNYTRAKVVVCEGGPSSWMQTYRTTYDCELGTVASGSFTLTGAKDFTFAAANTYGGATVLKGGTLHLAVADALPAGTTVSYEGGALTATAAAAPATIRFRTPDAAGVPHRFTLLTFTDEVPSVLPKAVYVDALGEEKACRVSVAGKAIRASVRKGTTLILR